MTKTERERIVVIETKLDQLEASFAELKSEIRSYLARAESEYSSRIECRAHQASTQEIRSVLTRLMLALAGSVIAAVIALLSGHGAS